MQAIIHDRGRQYLVTNGDSLLINHLAGAKAGSEHVFQEVLMLDGAVGAPYVKGAKVSAQIQEHVQGPKIYVEKFRRRKDYRRRNGHRQLFTRVVIGPPTATSTHGS
ncbi:MAG: 50S ribosomal protein L21 [Planctomycetota bacterium]